MLHAVEMTAPKNTANERLSLYPSELHSIAPSDRRAIAKTGEKSRTPILRIPRFEKKFKYGSHRLDKNLVKPFSSPGIHVSTILIEHKKEYNQKSNPIIRISIKIICIILTKPLIKINFKITQSRLPLPKEYQKAI